MDFTLNEEQTMIVDMVRKFVQQEIIPVEKDLDPDADEVDHDTYAKLVEKTKAMGLYGLDTPPEYGGPDISMVTRTLIAIECSQHRAGEESPSRGHKAFGSFGRFEPKGKVVERDSIGPWGGRGCVACRPRPCDREEAEEVKSWFSG